MLAIIEIRQDAIDEALSKAIRFLNEEGPHKSSNSVEATETSPSGNETVNNMIARNGGEHHE
ncbi:hypothetical protein DEI93_07100 [Curtobacterium sp. MCBD17_035]|uniref:hypothetical protein n=1 Tax=Curtobacterium sp. MCBD17_035 TaxID=2175673 RepID=UPI0011B506C1|nr:hypothetical protein [Curtobacterium sp. MCBD17_035]WIB68788.1 hypothetical protein DEI93_07100 [Curtobacterium sp. MCBD17_035]